MTTTDYVLEEYLITHLCPAVPGWQAVFAYRNGKEDGGTQFATYAVVAWATYRTRTVRYQSDTHRVLRRGTWMHLCGALCVCDTPDEDGAFLDRQHEQECSNAMLLGYRQDTGPTLDAWLATAREIKLLFE